MFSRTQPSKLHGRGRGNASEASTTFNAKPGKASEFVASRWPKGSLSTAWLALRRPA